MSLAGSASPFRSAQHFWIAGFSNRLEWSKRGTDMNISLRKFLRAQLACLSLFPPLAGAQSTDASRNLDECRAGRSTCDHSRLNQSESADVALALHTRNVVNCRAGFDSCDRSNLSGPEATALAVAEHKSNVAACQDGMQSCDKSKLTQSEAQDSSAADHHRNLTDCRDAVGSCDHSKLTQSEAG